MKSFYAGVIAATFLASPILAHPGAGAGGPPAGVSTGGAGGASGAASGGLGGFGIGMGAGPPIVPPGLDPSLSPQDAAHAIAAQKGQFGRDFAASRHLSAAEYQQMAAKHRADALALAAAARSGANIPASAGPRIREALNEDIQAWRDQFTVGRNDWQAMRNQWLADRGTMSVADWAQRRAAWFAARDAWIANQQAWAMARRP